ncbi:sulfatase family protein [Leeuwenhoekiella parthenopeia]|uniref:Sulfatase n=1 Tax=Leeuwenhoekiella parthenopeia TaxID=2890320 RepID=A0ABS8GQF3_9FLAO|nr:sulfatase [Leeuwenhoekiella parthenopeia]MCC4211522.1 sulfatase [Leeuwenhoekiella parthenopeia]
MKKVISALLFVFLCGILMACKTDSLEEKKRPNIIFLLTDDQRWDALGFAGNSIIQTPHLDSLAKHALYFKNAYVTTSICMVSRASILTGQYLSKHGIADFNTSLGANALAQTYPALLKDSGYYLGFVGKFGVGNPKKHPDTLFNYWAGSSLSQPKYEMFDQAGDSIHHTDLVNTKIQEFIKQAADKPFCLSVSFKAPHVQDGDPRQFIPKKEYQDLYSAAQIALPTTAASQYYDALPYFFKDEKNIARERWKLRFDTPEKFQESVKNYYRLITGVDDVVGDLNRLLKEQNLEDNTIIIFMGDNGMYLGEHGLAGKWFAHEESVRVPLFIYDPRNVNRAQKSEDIALNIDIAPTILELAGLKVPDAMQGISLLDAEKRQSRKDFYYEHSFMGSPALPVTTGVLDPNIKYIKYPEYDYEELYDLSIDPNETSNQIKNSEYADMLNAKRKRYLQLQEAAKK